MEYPDSCITTTRAFCGEDDCYRRQTCRLDVDKTVLPW